MKGKHNHTHTHTRLTALCPALPGWAGNRKAKPIWILLKQETVSGSGISWAICKSARSRQITTPAPHRSVFYRPDALPATQPTVSKHWRREGKHNHYTCIRVLLHCYENWKNPAETKDETLCLISRIMSLVQLSQPMPVWFFCWFIHNISGSFLPWFFSGGF